ncbi:uncharacterized protein AB675_1034 [Cyphellophora attinorum]|uniref:Uncharacterized protein n=1 Tax=Cyphellophora attinorum TaxID=1664694 RepID=A0A0N1H6S7_9EURO|nr:uncharacterized protein AB675_1034 [Phialophora attinorum]KPI38076.1 hypothetical protein AB675_1034 [Phialophora attinorum]
MSRDAHPTHLHLHASHHADLFEEFCRPPSSYPATSNTNNSHTHAHRSSLTNTPHHPMNLIGPPTHFPPTTTNGPGGGGSTDHGQANLPGHFLPYDPIPLPRHLEPVNPEDEDGLVPDQHAAFGILRARGGDLGANGVGGVNSEGGGMGAVANTNGEGVWRDLGLERVLGGGGDGGGRSEAGEGMMGEDSAGMRSGGAVQGGTAVAGGWNGVRRVVPGMVSSGRGGLRREGFARRRGGGGVGLGAGIR